MKIRTITRVSPDFRIKDKDKIYDLIPGATGSFYISFDEFEKREYIKLKTRPHKNLSIKKKMQMKPQIYYYKEVGVIVNGEDILYKE